MKTSDMNQKVAIERYTESQNSDGYRTGTWANQATVWCSVVPTSASERLRQDQFTAHVTHKMYFYNQVRLRGSPQVPTTAIDVLEKDKVTWENGREGTIKTIIRKNEGQAYLYELMVIEGQVDKPE